MRSSLFTIAMAGLIRIVASAPRRRGWSVLSVLRASREAVGVTDADFADLIHLNASGTARLSAWLRQALADPSSSDSVAQRERP